MKAIQARVTGQVQGVAFRWHTQEQAQRLGVVGWVRNEVDGSVLVHAEGEDEAVDALWSGAGTDRRRRGCATSPPATRRRAGPPPSRSPADRAGRVLEL